MKRFVVLDKKLGETPLLAIQKWKEQNLSYANTSASYAGRLDPMASGKLLVLLGEECMRQKAYTNLDKEYEIEVLLCVGSDTGDVLGLTSFRSPTKPSAEKLGEAIKKEIGAHTRAYPIFSSKTVRGKPLFMYALEGTLGSIDIPTHTERIYKIRTRDQIEISAQELEEKIYNLLALVPKTTEPSKKLGEGFRIDAVRAGWKRVFEGASNKSFIVLRLRVTCASGTYMRTLAPRIGASLGTSALALSIHRTKIGRYLPLPFGLGIWLSMY
jgi:tRNA pseudouridine55 synthase